MNQALDGVSLGRRRFLQLSSVALAGAVAVQESRQSGASAPAAEQADGAAPLYDTGLTYDSGQQYADDPGHGSYFDALSELLESLHGEGLVLRRDRNRLGAQLALAERSMRRGQVGVATQALDRFSSFALQVNDETARGQLIDAVERAHEELS